MAWVKLDDGFAEHPKVEEVGPLAGFLHVAALCYCNRNLTDGFIPAARVPKLADIPQWKRHVSALVRVGLWLQDDGGYRIHDYLDYQPSKAKVELEREDARKRMQALRAGKKAGSGSGDADSGASPFGAGSGEVRQMFARTTAARSGEVLDPDPTPAVCEKRAHVTRTRADTDAAPAGAMNWEHHA